MRQIRIYAARHNLTSKQIHDRLHLHHWVSDKDLVRCAEAGIGFDEIQFELGVGTRCGKCKGCARDAVA